MSRKLEPIKYITVEQNKVIRDIFLAERKKHKDYFAYSYIEDSTYAHFKKYIEYFASLSKRRITETLKCDENVYIKILESIDFNKLLPILFIENKINLYKASRFGTCLNELIITGYYFYKYKLNNHKNYNLINELYIKSALNPITSSNKSSVMSNIISCHPDLFPILVDRAEHIELGIPIDEALKKIGITNSMRLNHTPIYKHSKLSAKVMLNYIDTKSFGMNLKIAANPILTAIKDEWANIDVVLWASHFKQWSDSTTTYEYRGTPLTIHNHTLVRCIATAPYTKKGGFDFKVHPSTQIDPELLEKELLFIYDNSLVKFDIPPEFNENDDRYKILSKGNDLILEGQSMNHCIGGSNYIDRAKNGDFVYLHVNSPTNENGFSVELKKTVYNNPEIKPFYSVMQAYRKHNMKIDKTEQKIIDTIVDELNKAII